MGTEETSPDVNDKKNEELLSDLENKIIRQVEYYFGNFNLGKDRFLREQVKLNDGWIPMDTMIKFKRLKQLSEDFAIITAALKKSPNKLMEVNDDGSKIRRSLEKPLPDAQEAQVDRSVYVKGFPVDSTLDDLLEYFKQYWGPESIAMRKRKPSRVFKGSVFVTFQTKDDAEKFLELKDVKYNDTDLLRERKCDYVKRKNEWYEDMVKKREENKRKAKENSRNREDGGKGEMKVSEDDVVRGCLLKLTGLSSETMWEHIKEVLGKHGKISFVDYSRGKPEAIVRFESSVVAEIIENATVESEDGARMLKICDADVTAIIIEGDEEVEYWKTVASAKSRLKQKGLKKGWQNRGGKHGRGGGRGNFSKGRKRRHGAADVEEDGSIKEEQPKTKMPKKEASDATDVKVEVKTVVKVEA